MSWHKAIPRRLSDSDIITKTPVAKDVLESPTQLLRDDNLPSFQDLDNNIVKIAMLGEASVGKSALTVRFLTRRFITEYSPTLESTHNHEDTVDGKAAIYRILDTAGQDVKKESHILWADACVCVYSITNKGSFNTMQDIVHSIPLTKGTTSCPCIIVGNKSDLVHFREVSENEGEEFANSRECLFSEISASLDVARVRELFMHLYREVVKQRQVAAKPLSRRQRKFSIRHRFYSKSMKNINMHKEEEEINNNNENNINNNGSSNSNT